MTRPSPRVRNQRGVAAPSPVVMLSVVAVAMAGIAFVATRGGDPTEREVATQVAHESPTADPSASTSKTPKPDPKPTQPAVRRGSVYVEVYNNSGITGLAGRVGERASGIGWRVVGTDNWYGTIPATTVYYPARLKAAAKQLALDLGIHRTAPAVDPMRRDRLTIILTGDLS
ncbi:LytR C-terminal domain-containing protein [Nocardioides mangrovi]|uniref:LytR C-terminal domain-containing protein n=1 Tax=Nocardioides mangrovi TaxID=2874580 RepID=A0ABS7UCA1_9ACTN|nr:LytR C-terminal domain-containing protein [Nocardioides mangrovi]MBZ5738623.1 LytR C-terminal domain-containing protein [Nocardioides mangrovi]